MRAAFDAKQLTQEYQETDALLIDIARHHNVNYNTLKSYARRHKWKRHKRTNKKLDAIYNPDYYTTIPYRVAVFSFVVSMYGIDQTTAYRFTYCCSKNTARVNAYRLMKRPDVQYLLYYGDLLKGAYSYDFQRRQNVKNCFYTAFCDAVNVHEQLSTRDASWLPKGLRHLYLANEPEPEPKGLMYYH